MCLYVCLCVPMCVYESVLALCLCVFVFLCACARACGCVWPGYQSKKWVGVPIKIQYNFVQKRAKNHLNNTL